MTQDSENKRDSGNSTPLPTVAFSREEELEEKIAQLSKTNRHLKRKIFDLYTIVEISRNFNAVLHYQSLLDSFIFTCLGQVGALKGAAFLKRDVMAREYCAVKSKGSGDLPQPSDCFHEDSELLKYLAKLNRPVLTKDISSKTATEVEMAILQMFSGGLIVPLIFQTRLVGLFLLAEKISGQDFAPDDIEFLSVLGNQISVSIENARLYEAERAAMRQLRTAQQQLVQSERLAALGEMSAKIAHEVNNPLGIIKNYILLIQRHAEIDREIQDYAEVLSQEIHRIAGIVGQMRDFQRPVRMELRPVNVEAVAEEVLTLMGRQLRSSGIIVVRDYEPGPYMVEGCRDSLKQVFLNLMINARAAMENGGTLTLAIHTDGQELVIALQDSGAGIPPEIVPRIFEPFFTTKGEKGTGLGLSVCYGIIKSHKGSITFKNLEPGGCFEIRLPLMDGVHDQNSDDN
ncbi:MAG: hypothetical protein KKA42_07565 [candidate division Zixibacteria bacterium]|nr:hypothetical protein [candidate division Zixibacteria bacterium]